MKRTRVDESRRGARSQTGRVQLEPEISRWKPVTRVGFRFGFAYFGLFAVATQITGSLILFPNLSFRGMGQIWPMREITLWIASRFFGASSTLDTTGANGETIFFWVQTLWLLLFAVLATGIWSVLDRHRGNYVTAHKWFRLFIRFGLAAQMFEYGITKIIPNQFAVPSLIILATPAGDLSLNTHFWTSMGASAGYQMFTGWAELLAGILLLAPRTTLIGALICLADMIHVFTLNMAFDIGLKLTSLHMVLLTGFLLAPEFKRFANFLFLDRSTPPSAQPPLFKTFRRNRIALAMQILFGVYLIGMQTYANVSFWYADGGGAPKSPLYGIWNVELLSVDGKIEPPLQNDYDRQWRRVIFDVPGNMVFQRTDDSFSRYGVTVDVTNNTLAFTKGDSRNWRAGFTFERPSEDRLVLDGEMDGYQIHLELRRVRLDTYRLLNSRFRWIRPDNP